MHEILKTAYFSIEIKICGTPTSQLRYLYTMYLTPMKMNFQILNVGKQGFFPFPLFMLMNEQLLTSCVFCSMFKCWDYNISMSLEERV